MDSKERGGKGETKRRAVKMNGVTRGVGGKVETDTDADGGIQELRTDGARHGNDHCTKRK